MDRSLCVEAYHCEPSSATIHSWGCGMVCAASLASCADVIRDTESWLATPGWTRQIGWSPCSLAPRCPFFAKSASSRAGLPAPLRRGRTWACGDFSKPLAAEVFFGRRAPGHSTGMLLRPREVSQQGSLGFESIHGALRGWPARVVAGLPLSPGVANNHSWVDEILLPWAACAATKHCIAPRGSNRRTLVTPVWLVRPVLTVRCADNHRQDQAALSVLIHWK